MTAKQILDAFSETLMQDERILSSGERELLSNLLQNSKTVCGNPEIREAVVATIHRAIGETVAQRAFGLLGGSMVERILATTSSARTEEVLAHTHRLGPQPPGSGPQPSSGPQPGPHGKNPFLKGPTGPQPPGTPQAPGPHGLEPFTIKTQSDSGRSSLDGQHGVQVLDTPEKIQAKCVILDEFLAPQELEELLHYTLQHEADFQASEVISPSGDGDVIDYDHRRSRVLMNLGKHEEIVVQRIRGVLPQVLRQLGMQDFPVTRVEAQITASNDGDFFHVHCDDGQDSIALRELTFVYFFHREPCQFRGGELRLHDSRHEEGRYVGAGSYQTIVPQQNQIVFFPCFLPHEITLVECPSRAFADSRFTVNGWLRK
jgi:SM-20-related protein